MTMLDYATHRPARSINAMQFGNQLFAVHNRAFSDAAVFRDAFCNYKCGEASTSAQWSRRARKFAVHAYRSISMRISSAGLDTNNYIHILFGNAQRVRIVPRAS